MNILLILLVLHYLYVIIFKPKITTLNCGIFAWAGNNPKKFNKAKFDIQGLYNDSRGGDSCGITTDGEIYYGVERNSKEYKDFLVESDYYIPVRIPTVFGHTRKSSHGIVNYNNAHPFGFGDHKDGFRFIGCHNGTLHNHKELATKYNVDDTVYKLNDYNIKVHDRSKIDSEILLEAIYNDKGFHPLEHYIGGAALLFTDTKEPNILYAFHGASKPDWNDDASKATEERPLYYYIENKNSLYISSMSESLIAIGGVINETVFEFECNKVYKIKNGDIENCETFKINRNNAHQSRYMGGQNFGHYPNFSMVADRSKKQKDTFVRTRGGAKRKRRLNDLLNFEINNIYDEKEERLFKSPIIFSNLRYKRNGHPITGIYTWVPDYGLVWVSAAYKTAYEDTERLVDIPFSLSEGWFIKSQIKQVNIDYTSGDVIIPYQTIRKTKPPILYFYDGILIQEEVDYVALTEKYKKFTFDDLSFMAKHPIIEIKQCNRSPNDQRITKDGKQFTGVICPLGSKKIYDIDNGNLITITMREESIIEEDNESEPILLPLNAMSIIDEQSDESFMDNTIKEFIEEKSKEIVDFTPIEDEDPPVVVDDDSFAKDAIDKAMTPIYLNLQTAELELKKFHTHTCVKEILEANNDYLMTLDELINVEQ